MEHIRAEGLTKFYGTVRGIEGLELSVQEGDFFGFIGPNGAGKSTTIRTLLGLISPDSGRASVLGMDPARERVRILSEVGFMPSETNFYGGMRVGEVIRLSAALRRRDCTAEAARLCGLLSLDTGKKIDELSLGNRKKVSIVCALQHKPSLYVLDEPTSGLDPLVQHTFFSILEERNREGATIFLSSHVLSEIQRHCTNAAVIRDGHAVVCGSVDSLAETNARRVSLRGTLPDLTQLSGVHNLQTGDGGCTFLYDGELKALLRLLGEADISDLSIAEPDLEEIFMHYYERGDEK